MAHTKATGSAKRNVNVAGKRLGIKLFAGEYAKPGNIIVRQRGSQFYPGINTMIGRDYTIFATASGHVSFRHMSGPRRGQKFVDVTEVLAAPVAAKVEKAAQVEVAAEKAETKATAKKTTKTSTTSKKSTAKKATKA